MAKEMNPKEKAIEFIKKSNKGKCAICNSEGNPCGVIFASVTIDAIDIALENANKQIKRLEKENQCFKDELKKRGYIIK